MLHDFKKILGARKPKGPKQNNNNLLWSSMSEQVEQELPTLPENAHRFNFCF